MRRWRPPAASTRPCPTARTSTWSGAWRRAATVRYEPGAAVHHPVRPASVPGCGNGTTTARRPRRWPSAIPGRWRRSRCRAGVRRRGAWWRRAHRRPGWRWRPPVQRRSPRLASLRHPWREAGAAGRPRKPVAGRQVADALRRACSRWPCRWRCAGGRARPWPRCWWCPPWSSTSNADPGSIPCAGGAPPGRRSRYGAGLWAGSLAARTTAGARPLRPLPSTRRFRSADIAGQS